MTIPAVAHDGRLKAEVMRLVALSPPGGDGRINALVRLTCAQALGLPPLAAEVEAGEPESADESVAVEFAEQFAVDVSSITAEQRARLLSALGSAAFRAVVLIYVADFIPRVRAGLQALGAADVLTGPIDWDRKSDPADAVFNGFLPAVARLKALDPVTSEIVRLRGAAQHNCRLCKSLREGSALDAGGSETLYAAIDGYETSGQLTDRHKAALRYVDALIWSPAHIGPEIAEGMQAQFSDDEAVELTFDVMRNASNKIAVAMAADAPRVEHGTERYQILPDGQTKFV
jgi:alkylhydroperoxidase family enzyme